MTIPYVGNRIKRRVNIKEIVSYGELECATSMEKYELRCSKILETKIGSVVLLSTKTVLFVEESPEEIDRLLLKVKNNKTT